MYSNIFPTVLRTYVPLLEAASRMVTGIISLRVLGFRFVGFCFYRFPPLLGIISLQVLRFRFVRFPSFPEAAAEMITGHGISLRVLIRFPCLLEAASGITWIISPSSRMALHQNSVLHSRRSF